jgi:alkylation response protein AidB-like acyl-CoA dehydrogenase
MDFSYSEEQQALRELAARLLGQRFTDAHRKAFARGGAPYDAELWAMLARAGLLGTAFSAAAGGSGLGLTELGLLLEEQGRSLAQLPLMATLVLGALPLQRFGTPAQCALLPRIAAGELLVTAALEEPAGGDLQRPVTAAAASAQGWALTGVKTCVPYGAQAQHLLVAARLASGSGLLLVERGAPGVRIEPQRSTSAEPQALITFSAVRLAAGDLVGDQCGDALAWLIERAHVALAAQQLGVVEEALRRTAAYVSERQQFGRPLGSFQAVQHRLADGYIAVEALRSAYLRAVWALDHGVPDAAAVRAAKWWAARAGHQVTHTAQHLHGGLGADVEYPIHAFFLRAKQLELSLGGATQMLAEIGAQLAGDGVPAFT